MKFLIAGDWHGYINSVQNSMMDAQMHNATKIIQVGDFGFFGEGRFVRNVSVLAVKNDIPVYWVEGNHESFDVIDMWTNEFERNEDGHIEIAPMVFYIPRGTVWEWEGKTFMGLGGAASIDRGYRQLGLDYFPQELITMGDCLRAFDNVEKHGKRVDYFFAHDCSNETPWGFNLVPDPQSLQNRLVMDGVLASVRPRFMWHGHMHAYYDWTKVYSGTDEMTKVWGLNMNDERNSRGVFDTENESFELCTYHVPKPVIVQAAKLA